MAVRHFFVVDEVVVVHILALWSFLLLLLRIQCSCCWKIIIVVLSCGRTIT